MSDGAAAIVLTDVDTALKMDKAVYFRAAQHVQDYLPMSKRNVIDFEGPSEAFARAFAEAGVSLEDLGFAEVHDCFTTAELLSYEAMGLTERGQGRNRDQGRLDPRRWQASGKPVGRPEIQGAPAGCDRPVDARDCLDATDRPRR